MKTYEKLMVLSFPFHVFLFMTTEKDSWTQHIKTTKTAIKSPVSSSMDLLRKSLATLIANHKICYFSSKELCQRSCAHLAEEKIYIFIYTGMKIYKLIW